MTLKKHLHEVVRNVSRTCTPAISVKFPLSLAWIHLSTQASTRIRFSIWIVILWLKGEENTPAKNLQSPVKYKNTK